MVVVSSRGEYVEHIYCVWDIEQVASRNENGKSLVFGSPFPSTIRIGSFNSTRFDIGIGI